MYIQQQSLTGNAACRLETKKWIELNLDDFDLGLRRINYNGITETVGL